MPIDIECPCSKCSRLEPLLRLCSRDIARKHLNKNGRAKPPVQAPPKAAKTIPALEESLLSKDPREEKLFSSTTQPQKEDTCPDRLAQLPDIDISDDAVMVDSPTHPAFLLSPHSSLRLPKLANVRTLREMKTVGVIHKKCNNSKRQ